MKIHLVHKCLLSTYGVPSTVWGHGSDQDSPSPGLSNSTAQWGKEPQSPESDEPREAEPRGGLPQGGLPGGGDYRLRKQQGECSRQRREHMQRLEDREGDRGV